jgi:hypothetical protein
MSCQRKFVMLARLRSFGQAVLNPVLISRCDAPPFVCWRQRLSKPIASSFRGTCRVWRFFEVPPSTVRNRRLNSMDSHRSARSSPRRSPVFMDRSTAGVRWSPKWGPGRKQLSLTLLTPHVARLARFAHLGIARAERCSEPRLFLVIQKTYLGSAIDPRLIYPANGVVGQLPSLTARRSTQERVKMSRITVVGTRPVFTRVIFDASIRSTVIVERGFGKPGPKVTLKLVELGSRPGWERPKRLLNTPS